jgi:hypothetical protein
MRKTHKFPAPQLAACVGGTLLLAIVACSKDCTEISTLYNAFRQAIVYPEQFDTYLENNRASFDSAFFDKIDDIQRNISEAAAQYADHCNDTFLTGSDFWNQCHNEAESGGFLLAVLGALEAAAQGQTAFVLVASGFPVGGTDAGILLYTQKFFGGSTISEYENLFGEVVTAIRPTFLYEECEGGGFLGIF